MDRLIIDDRRTFRKPPRGDYTLHVRDLESAEDALKEQAWDEVWFDYDMGPDQDTFMFLRAIELGVIPMQAKTVFIHTMNPIGRWHIEDALSGKYNVTMIDPYLVTQYFDSY